MIIQVGNHIFDSEEFVDAGIDGCSIRIALKNTSEPGVIAFKTEEDVERAFEKLISDLEKAEGGSISESVTDEGEGSFEADQDSIDRM